MELQKVPRIKNLYERYFKNHPELINPASIVNLVSSSLLGCDDDTGAVRDSIADVLKKKQTPSSTIPSLQVTKENEFDRILLLVLNHFLTDKGIPEGFLKSNYFTLRPQLVQLYQEDPTFRTRLEEALDRVEEEVTRDYKMLVNETNRIEPTCPNIHSKKWHAHLEYNHRSEGSRLQRTNTAISS